MKILQIRTITGPNVYHNKPVLVMKLDLENLADVDSTQIPHFTERLLKYLPGLWEHRCSPGRPGGFVERLRRGTYFAHMIEHIALELSTPAGIEVGYGKSTYAGEPGIYQVVVRYKNEEGMKFLLKTAVELAQSLVDDVPYPLADKLKEAQEIVTDTQLGPSTQAIVTAAEKRNIPWMRLNHLNLIQFGYGKNRKLIQATTSSMTSDIAVDIAKDKELTKKMLDDASIRVPLGDVVYSPEEAIASFHRVGAPVVLKPVDGNHGKGVSMNLMTEEQVREAFLRAEEYSNGVLVEEQFMGHDFRILVVGGKLVAAARRRPAHVVGDGKSSVIQLIEAENQNPLRGEGHEKPLTKIRVDAEAEKILKRAGLTLSSIPKLGEIVYLKDNANISTGGSAEDVTDEVHPQIRMMCERAARTVGLDICGIDFVGETLAKPAHEQKGGIIEINAGPGIRMHHYPSAGKPRDVGAAIIDMLYPPGTSARVPIIAITGTNGKTTTTRLIEHMMRLHGLKTGMTTSDGIFIEGLEIATGDTTGPASARTVLTDPGIDVAVLETARGGITRRGLAFDWCDIGIITNIQPDHIGQDGIESVEDILRIKSLVVERVRPGGTIILNADDPHLVELSTQSKIHADTRSLVFFSIEDETQSLWDQISQGRTGYFVRKKKIYEVKGMVESFIMNVDEIPLTFGGTATYQVANALAAIAACRSYGMPIAEVVRTIAEFHPNQNSGRANLYRAGKGYVLLDYGHNPDAVKAVSGMVSQWNLPRLTGVLTVPGDRSDEMIQMSGTVAANGFDRLIIREDRDQRGRKPGEIAKLIEYAVLKENPKAEYEIELDPDIALERAVHEMVEGELVVYFYDEIDTALETLKRINATLVPDMNDVRKKPDENMGIRRLEVG